MSMTICKIPSHTQYSNKYFLIENMFIYKTTHAEIFSRNADCSNVYCYMIGTQGKASRFFSKTVLLYKKQKSRLLIKQCHVPNVISARDMIFHCGTMMLIFFGLIASISNYLFRILPILIYYKHRPLDE